MENEFLESNIDVAKGIRVLAYRQDRPAVFFTDKSGFLQVAFGDHQIESLVGMKLNVDNNFGSGWLTKQLSEAKVASFDVAYTNVEKTRFRIAIGQSSSTGTKILLSDEIGQGQPLGDLCSSIKFKSLCTEKDIVVTQMTLSPKGLLCAGSASGEGGVSKFSWYEHGKARMGQPIAVQPEKFLQVAHGLLQGRNKLVARSFILSMSSSGDPIMHVQEFPYKDGATNRIGEGVRCFDLATDKETGQNILYLGKKKGISKHQKLGLDKEIVTNKGNFSKIRATRHKGIDSVWALGEVDGQKGLFYLTNGKLADEDERTIQSSTWSVPILMAKNAEDFDCMRGSQVANQLFYLDSAKKALIHLWQDAWSGKWEEESVKLNLRKVNTRKTFTANIRFSSTSPQEWFLGREVKLSASGNMRVYLNDRQVLLGPEQKVALKLADANLQVVFPTSDISPHQLFVEAEWLGQRVDINLAESTHKRLNKTFSSPDKLRKAKKANKEPLVPSKHKSKIEKVAEFSEEIFGIVNKSGGSQSGGAGAPSAQESGGLLLSFSFDGEDILTSTPVAWTSLGATPESNALQDLLYSVRKGLTKLSEIAVSVAKKGCEIAIRIGKEVFKFINKSARALLSCLEQVWASIKIFFKDIFDCFAFIFDWEDILRAKNALRKAMTNAINSCKKQIPEIRDSVMQKFDGAEKDLEDRIKNIKLSDGKTFSVNDINEKHKPQQDVDPRATWIVSKNEHLERAPLPDGIDQEVGETLHKAQGISNGLIDEIEKLKTEFEGVFRGNLDLGQFMNILMVRIAKLAAKIGRQGMEIIFEMLDSLMSKLPEMLNKKIDIPFFSDIYEREAKAPLTMLDLSCLMIAIPATAFSKIIRKKPLFDSEKDVDNFAGSFQSLEANNSGEAHLRFGWVEKICRIVAGATQIIRGFFHIPKELCGGCLGLIDFAMLLFFLIITNFRQMTKRNITAGVQIFIGFILVYYYSIGLRAPDWINKFVRHYLAPLFSLLSAGYGVYKLSTEPFKYSVASSLTQSVLALGHFHPIYMILKANPPYNGGVQGLRAAAMAAQGIFLIEDR